MREEKRLRRLQLFSAAALTPAVAIVFALLSFGTCIVAEITANTGEVAKGDLQIFSRDMQDVYEVAKQIKGKDVIVLLGNSGTGKSTLSKYIRGDPTLRVLKHVSTNTVSESKKSRLKNKQRKSDAQGEEHYRLIFTDGEDKIGSNSSVKSKTLIPNVDEDPETGVYFVDCAGFADTRGPRVDLSAAYFNKLTLDSSGRVKIIVVENYVNLKEHGNRNTFSIALQHTTRLLGENLHAMEGAVGLVATKVERTLSEGSVFAEIEAFLSVKLDQLTKDWAEEKNETIAAYLERQISLLQMLSENVEIFWTPDQEQLDKEEKERGILREYVLNLLNFSTPFTHKFQASVEAETKSFVRDTLLSNADASIKNETTILQKSFKEHFYTIIPHIQGLQSKQMVRSTVKFCTDYLHSLGQVMHLKEMWQFTERLKLPFNNLAEVRFLAEKAIFLHELINDGFQEKEILQKLKSVFEEPAAAKLAIASFLEEMIIDFANYNPQIKGQAIEAEIDKITEAGFKDFATNLKNWGFDSKTARTAISIVPNKQDIEWFKQFASEFKQSTIVEQKYHTTVTFFSRFLILSKIKARIEGRGQDEGEFVLVASEKLFIDCDLRIQHAHLKMVAPIAHVVEGKNVEIRLTGQDGRNQNGKATSCNRGQDFWQQGPLHWPANDGLSGHDAYSSGDFAMMALQVQNGYLLTVKSQGGNGGKGQDGGDGCDAIKFPDSLDHVDTVGIAGRCYPYEDCHYHDYLGVMDGGHKNQCFFYTVSPTDGRVGGTGGRGGTAGHIVQFVRDDTRFNAVAMHGKQGIGGKGGKAGMPKIGKTCYTIIEMITPLFFYVCRSWLWRDHECTEKFKFASQGSDGKIFDQPHSMKQMFTSSNWLDQVLKMYDHASTQSQPLDEKTSAGEFFQFFINSENILHRLTPTDLLRTVQSAEQSLRSHYAGLHFRSHMFLYSTLLQSAQSWNRIHQSNNSEGLEMYLISMLDTLRTFHQGKQVVQLITLANSQLKRLKSVDSTSNQVEMFEVVKREKTALQKTIEAASLMIEEVKKSKIDEIKEHSAKEISVLLEKITKVKEQREEEKKKLAGYKGNVIKNIAKKVGLGLLGIVSTVAGIFFPPAAAIGPTIAGITNAASRGPGELQYNPGYDGIKLANEMFLKFESKKEEKKKKLLDMTKSIGELDAADAFLSNETRAMVLVVADSESLSSIDLKPMFEALEHDFASKIESLKDTMDGNQMLKVDKFESYRTSVKRTGYILGTAAEIGNIYLRCAGDKEKLDQVDAAIKDNLERIEDIGKYEESIHKTFEPLVKQMVHTFDSMSADAKNQNQFELIFQKLELKSHAKQFLTVFQKLTQDFFAKDEGFSTIVTNLQDLLSTLIEAYDQIEQLKYRVRLSEFIGKISGVKCTTEECNDLKKLSQTIKLKQLIRDFGFVFTAYQQTSFPFGAQKVEKLNSNVIELLSASNEEVAVMLRKNLENIRDVLIDESSLTDKKDADVIKSEFSMMKTTRPFFSWRSHEQKIKIRRLLRGEQITLDASVYESGVKNAVKANWITLNITSADAKVAAELKDLLDNFHLEMVRGKRSYFRCGASFYAISGEELNLTQSFETNRQGKPVAVNVAVEKVFEGDVALSPYVLWKFRLIHKSEKDPAKLHKKLASLAPLTDLHLVGQGSYVNDGAEICSSPLSEIYEFVGVA